MAEAQRETIKVQRLNILVVTLHLGVVIYLWYAGILFLPLLFCALIIEWFIAGLIAKKMYSAHEE